MIQTCGATSPYVGATVGSATLRESFRYPFIVTFTSLSNTEWLFLRYIGVSYWIAEHNFFEILSPQCIVIFETLLHF